MTRKVTQADVELAKRYVVALERLFASPAWIVDSVEAAVVDVNWKLAESLPVLEDLIVAMGGDRSSLEGEAKDFDAELRALWAGARVALRRAEAVSVGFPCKDDLVGHLEQAVVALENAALTVEG